MKVINFFDSSEKEKLIAKIDESDWSASKFLVKLLREEQFDSTLGEGGSLFLLMDGESLVSFVTLTKKDCVDDDSLFPWMGFFFTFPQYRGKRYGGMVLEYAAKAAKNRGYDTVYLATDHVGLYEKYGFEYMETRVSESGEEDRIYRMNLKEIEP